MQDEGIVPAFGVDYTDVKGRCRRFTPLEIRTGSLIVLTRSNLLCSTVIFLTGHTADYCDPLTFESLTSSSLSTLYPLLVSIPGGLSRPLT